MFYINAEYTYSITNGIGRTKEASAVKQTVNF